MRTIIPLIAVIALSTLLLAGARSSPTPTVPNNDVEIYNHLMSQIHEPTLLASPVYKPTTIPSPDDLKVLASSEKSLHQSRLPFMSTDIIGHAGKFKIGFPIEDFADAGDEIHIIQVVDVVNVLGYERLSLALWTNPKTNKILPLADSIRNTTQKPPTTQPPRHPSTQPYWPSFIQPDPDAIAQCQQIALQSYQSLMKDRFTGTEKASDPVAFVSKYAVENLGSYNSQNPLWQISIQSEAGQLMGLFWYNPLDKKIKPLIGAWQLKKDLLPDSTN